LSNSVSGGTRTVVLNRPLEGLNSDYYTFHPDSSSINFINALGASPELKYHANRTGSTISLSFEGGATCLCKGGSPGSINGIPFGENCAEFPLSDIKLQKNTACFVETFGGGLNCCWDKTFLLDADQEIPPEQDTFHLKFRFYYEEYTSKPIPSHNQLFRIFWMTEVWQGQYDIPKCADGTPTSQCVHTLTSHFSLNNIMSDCNSVVDPWCADKKLVTEKGVYLIYAAGHCHAPACISMDLIDERNGNLLCRNTMLFGKSEKALDEEGYVVGIPPCLWSPDDPLLPPPPILHLDTPLLSIARVNSTYAHWGDMAMWQMRGSYVQ